MQRNAVSSFQCTSVPCPPEMQSYFWKRTAKVDGIRAMTQGASISIQAHPNNPSARLLVIAGSNAEELARATRALALQSPTFTGQVCK